MFCSSFPEASACPASGTTPQLRASAYLNEINIGVMMTCVESVRPLGSVCFGMWQEYSYISNNAPDVKSLYCSGVRFVSFWCALFSRNEARQQNKQVVLQQRKLQATISWRCSH